MDYKDLTEPGTHFKNHLMCKLCKLHEIQSKGNIKSWVNWDRNTIQLQTVCVLEYYPYIYGHWKLFHPFELSVLEHRS